MASFDYIEEVNLTNVLKKIPNKFLLSTGVAKRARQLQEGSKPLITVKPDEPFLPINIALKEIDSGLIDLSLLAASTDDLEFLDKMDEILDAELVSESAEVEKQGKKKEIKDQKTKIKSKTLGA